MKCCKWGHFTVDCHAQHDTCSTCGGKHRSKDCTAENKRYCVSCKSDSHASCARECPEFLRKCKEYNGYHPENKLIYFPTDEDWTLTTHPERIPFEDKFPERFAVASLPLPNRTERQLPTHPIGKKNKQQSQTGMGGQAVLETYFGSQPNAQGDKLHPPTQEVDNNDDFPQQQHNE